MSGPGHDKKLRRPGMLPSNRPIVMVAVVVTVIVVSVAMLHEQIPWANRQLAVLIAWGLFMVGVGAIVWRGHRKTLVERHVVEHRFRCCTECGYSLHDAPQAGQCPECGAEYELDRTIRAWQTWLNR